MIKSDLVNIEYRQVDYFPYFKKRIARKDVIIVCDENTQIYARKYLLWLQSTAKRTYLFVFKKDFIPDEQAINSLLAASRDYQYLLAVGSGTINDLCKYVGECLDKPTGVIPTAPSMDGYLSKGSALIIENKKVTKTVKMPLDILIDLDILVTAPKEMIIAGYGDIIGKFTALADWNLSNLCNHEEINDESYQMMREALNKTLQNIKSNNSFSKASIENLIDALNVAGIAMAIAGNSRPASGSEHHISHYLEMNFLSKNQPCAAHGVKVALGCLVSLELYKKILEKTENVDIINLIESLPSYDEVLTFLKIIKAPLKFKDINVDKDLFIDMLYNAHKIRDRFTILSYYHQHHLMDQVVNDLVQKFIE